MCGAACSTQPQPCPALQCCPTFSCNVAPFTSCSSSCGSGTRTAIASCVQTCSGQQSQVELSACSSAGVSCASQTVPCATCPLLPGQIIPGAVATIVGAPVTVQGQPVQVRLPDTTVDVPVQVRGTPAPAPDNLVYVPVSAPQPVAVSIPVQIVGPTYNGRYYRDSAGSCYDSFTQQPTTAANCLVATSATTSCSPGYISNGVTCVLANAISCSPGYVSNGVTCVLSNAISCPPGYVSNGVTCVLSSSMSSSTRYSRDSRGLCLDTLQK